MKMMFRIFFISAMLSAFTMGRARAHPVSELQKRELVQLVNDINSSARRRDTSLIVNNMPARLYRAMAERMHMTETALRESLRKSVQAQFEQIGENAYRLDAAGIQYAETKDGTPYALVPTRIETDSNIVEFMTLALYDNTKWHLVYGGQKTVQNPVFLEIYPAFANVSMPAPKVSRKK